MGYAQVWPQYLGPHFDSSQKRKFLAQSQQSLINTEEKYIENDFVFTRFFWLKLGTQPWKIHSALQQNHDAVPLHALQGTKEYTSLLFQIILLEQ